MSPAKLRCVIVDDDREFLEQIKRWFLTSGEDLETVLFSNSTEALDYLRCERVDLLLTAYLIAPMDGLQLISIVRGSHPRLPVCMMSNVPIRASALARGVTVFVPKAQLWSQLGSVLNTLRDSAVSLAA